MSEIWKEYKRTHKAVWEVSNYGNVKKNGEPYECGLNGSGYKQFADTSVHKAVAKLFIPNPEDKPQVDHIDTNKLNNHVDNLRWCTHKENCNNSKTRQHNSEAHKGKQTGENNGMYGKGYKMPWYGKKRPDHGEKMTGENNPMSKRCPYNGIEFGSIADAWRYAKDYCGYEYGYNKFRKQFK